jgi:hypothetical protein
MSDLGQKDFAAILDRRKNACNFIPFTPIRLKRCGRARTSTSVAGGHVRFRAEGLRRNTSPAKKRLQFHSVRADPLKALRTRQSGHLRQNIFYACPLSGIGGAARLAIEAAVSPRRANPSTSSGANR